MIIVFVFIGCGESDTSTVNIFGKEMVIPAYFRDTNDWEQIKNMKQKATIVINPHNGPGEHISSFYEQLLKKDFYNKTFIGYIYTKWGDRYIGDVEDDIDRWLNYYPGITGFFIDESSASSSKIAYYKELIDYIKNKNINYSVMLNPGTKPDDDYFAIADKIVVFETDIKYLHDKEICSDYPEHSVIIAYNSNKTEMIQALQKKGCKYFYITNNSTNLYSSLPSYFKYILDILE